MIGQNGSVMPAGRGSLLPWMTDVLVAAIFAIGFWAPNWPSSGAAERGLWVGAVLVLTAAILLRWKMPTTSPIVALAVTVMGWFAGLSGDPLLAVAWCLYPLAMRRGVKMRLIGFIALGALLLISVVTAVPESLLTFGQSLVTGAGAIGAVWLLGNIEGQRQAAIRRAEQDHAAAERARQQSTMAREVHDVVGHSLSVISAEAAIARDLPDANPHEWQDALASIGHAVRSKTCKPWFVRSAPATLIRAPGTHPICRSW